LGLVQFGLVWGKRIKTSYWYNEKEQAKKKKKRTNENEAKEQRGMWKLFALGSSQKVKAATEYRSRAKKVLELLGVERKRESGWMVSNRLRLEDVQKLRGFNVGKVL
jgi:hypothetical protein